AAVRAPALRGRRGGGAPPSVRALCQGRRRAVRARRSRPRTRAAPRQRAPRARARRRGARRRRRRGRRRDWRRRRGGGRDVARGRASKFGGFGWAACQELWAGGPAEYGRAR
ncbi:hypothetical protein MNEG_16491, partial [Monoraphidium neglectum]